ncbi:uncharacterized protein LOC135263699 isoform X2 [Anguilla rostrata]|uniref:uncharacterized protein LOC135263699 isoform X2 n=1 Tax=Anguilla rostrata TaxID=7938 RepID=UPI0030CEF20C
MSRRITPQNDAIYHVTISSDKKQLEMRYINPSKGRGVFALAPFSKGDFVVEYKGQLIDPAEAQRRRRIYHSSCTVFMYDFLWHGKTWCIDASLEDGSLGRLINDDCKSPNCKIKRIIVDGKPHLCIFALKNISTGEEITYNYGNNDWPWREKVTAVARHTGTDTVDTGMASSSSSHLIDQVTAVAIPTGTDTVDTEMASSCSPPLIDQITGEATLVADMLDVDEICDSGAVLHGKLKDAVTSCEAKNKVSSCDLQGAPDSALAEEKPDSEDERESSDDSREESRNSGSDSTIDGRTIVSKIRHQRNSDVPVLRRTKSLLLNERILAESDFSEYYDSSADSEENYIPDSCEESSNSDETVLIELPPKTPVNAEQHDSVQQQESPPLPDSTTTEDKERDTVSIKAIKKKEDGSRGYMKKQFCLFCEKSVSKIARHLEQVHSNEPEVAKALVFPKGSKGRKIHLELLRNKGNFAHNVSVIKTGSGELVPGKQPQKDAHGKDFMHCAYCQGLFSKKYMWRHAQNCHLKPKEDKPKPGKNRIQALFAFAEPIPSGVSQGLWKLICCMNTDKISLAIKSDRCIIHFGEHLYNRHGSDAGKHEYIRQKLRELGRLLINASENTPLKSIEDLVMPANFLHTVKAVQHTAGYDSETSSFRTPSLALKLGHSLQKISRLVECQAMIEGKVDIAKNASSFRQIYDTRWNEIISASALKSLRESKWNMPQLLPFTEDVRTLHSYLDEKQQEYYGALSAEPSTKSWSNLVRVTLAQIILFNRRREGEVSKMPVTAFTSRDQSGPHEDIDLALSELEQKVCRHFTRLEIRGKRGRKVPVLLTPQIQKALELMVEKRDANGVPSENGYMFARPSALSHYRGSDCIRQLVHACGLKNPSTLTSTKLRKHVATVSKVLNLNDTELDQLADFLGHDIRVHRQYYRLPEGTLQLAKISKILMALEQGRLAEFKGKNLDQIHIDPEEQIQVQSDMSADEEECESPETEVTGKEVQKKRKSWVRSEVHAVEKHLMHFIQTYRVPGKDACEACIKAEPLSLKDRNWLAVKFYIKNRITALQRKD